MTQCFSEPPVRFLAAGRGRYATKLIRRCDDEVTCRLRAAVGTAIVCRF